jgi:hypothetical protein
MAISVVFQTYGAQFTTTASLHKPISAPLWTHTHLCSRSSGLAAASGRGLFRGLCGRAGGRGERMKDEG